MTIKIGTQTVKVTPGYQKVILGGEAWPTPEATQQPEESENNE